MLKFVLGNRADQRQIQHGTKSQNVSPPHQKKTALLIAVSRQLGAIASGADEKIHKALYWFGYYVGMSYQIIDDILDFTSTEEELGKPVGGDLLQGNVTLPVLYALKIQH